MRTTIILSLGAAILVGCGTTNPPKELVDARAAYRQAAAGPAAQQNPAELHVAKQALDRAETKFSNDGDEPATRDFAYVAARKAQLADAAGRVTVALKEKQAMDLEAQRFQVQSLKTAQSDLANTRQNLAKTQSDLDRERLAREEADKKAALAMADLQKLASVKQEPRGMVITLSGSVLFATDQATLLPAAVVKLNEVADALIKGNPDANITIEGHTDSQGQLQHNMELSQRRAEAVKAQLVARGVAADRIKTTGVGPDRPIADNKSPEGRANNRRVEIIVEPQKPSP